MYGWYAIDDLVFENSTSVLHVQGLLFIILIEIRVIVGVAYYLTEVAKQLHTHLITYSSFRSL